MGRLISFTAPIHCRREILALQLIRGAVWILMKDLAFTEEMVVSVFGHMVKEVEENL